MNKFPHYDCRANIPRRHFLGGALGGFSSFALANQQLVPAGRANGRAKRCLILWMDGGPSQMETFDPKPGTGTGGPTKAIETAVSGLQIAESLPQLAKRMDKLSVIRNLTSREGEHERARYYLHTGYKLVEGFPRPSLGSMMSHQVNSQPMPNYVSIGSSGYGPTYLGAEHGPFSIEDPEEARRLLRVIESRKTRLKLTRTLSEDFDRTHESPQVKQRLAALERIEQLIDTPFSKALALDEEPERAWERFQARENEFGKRMLVAKRMLELGIPFVEVNLGGWDTHQENFSNVSRLCRQLDQPWAAMMDELGGSGLLDETLVVWLGEFGRTPVINANHGRDHFPQVTPVVIGGAGVAHGGVIGKTNRAGTAIDGAKHYVPDLFATIFEAMGFDSLHEFPTDFGSMTKATDDGEVIAELL